MKALRFEEIRGNWATLLLSWNGDESLDMARIHDEIEVLISMKVSGIYCCGSAGEFHALRENEFDDVAEALAARCATSDMPFQIGVSHMSAQVSLDRLRRSVALAPSAFQVILPDWLPVHDIEAVDFLKQMAEAAKGIGLVLYNPPHAKRLLSTAEIGRLAQQVPEVVGVKVAGGDAAWYDDMRRNIGHLSVFVAGHRLASGYSMGAHGAYSNAACLHPGAAQRWWELMQTDLPAALELEKRLCAFIEGHIVPFITQQGYCGGACDRLMAQIGGWADLGSRMRWPYRAIPETEASRLRPLAEQILPEFSLD